MSKWQTAPKRRTRLSIEPLEPRRLLDVSGVWQELGFRSASGGGLSYDGQYMTSGDPVVAVTAQGHAVVAYEGAGGIQARIYDGAAWVSIDDPTQQIIPNTSGGQDPDIATDDLGNVYVSWRKGWGSGTDVYMTQGFLDPTTGEWAWNGLGGSDTGTGVSDDGVVNGTPAIAVGVDGLPVMAYAAYDDGDNDMDVVAKKYIAQLDEWVELCNADGPDFLNGGGGVSNDDLASAGWPNSPQAVDIAIGGDNAPVVVWSSTRDESHEAEIYGRRWNAMTSMWEEVGEDSASGAGISQSADNAVEPIIQIRQDPDDPDQDITMVAWFDHELNMPESAVFVRQLNESSGQWEAAVPGSADGDGIIGRANHRNLSMVIDHNGLPLLGLSRLQTMPDEYAIDTTEPWSEADDSWFAAGLEYDTDAGAWAWLGDESPNYGVSQAMDTAVVELPPNDESSEPSPLLVFAEDVDQINTDAYINGGPYDPSYYPVGADDAEIYAHRFDRDLGEWTNYGEGSGDSGGMDNDIRWNTDPVLGTDEDGRVLAAFAERSGQEIFIRVRYFDEETGAWKPYGTGLESGIPFDQTEVGNHSYRWDEVVIGSDPSQSAGTEGRPFVAYLDYINTTNPSDPDIYNRATISVWAYDETTGTWESAAPGTSGVDQYAYVMADATVQVYDEYGLPVVDPFGFPVTETVEGTVWNGFLIDQIELIAGPGDTTYLAWRHVDPTVDRDPDDNKDPTDPDYPYETMVHIEDVSEGGRLPYDSDHGGSDIYVYKGTEGGGTWTWEVLADKDNPFGAMPQYESLNFDPSLVLTSDGHVWVAFTAGDITGISDGGEATSLLLTDLSVYEYDDANNLWENKSGGLPSADWGAGGSYGHPELALGEGGLPVLVWESQTWTRQSLQSMGLLGGWSAYYSNDVSQRPLWGNDNGVDPQWRIKIPEAAVYDEPLADDNETYSSADVIDAASIHTSIAGEIRAVHAYWDSANMEWKDLQDIDFYKVQGLPPNAYAVVAVTGIPGGGKWTPTLDVYDEAGRFVQTVTASAALEGDPLDTPLEVDGMRADASGTLVFSITGKEGDVGAYTVEVYTDPSAPYGPDVYEEQEVAGADANNVYGDAESFAPGDYIVLDGTLDSSDDVDFFELTGLYQGSDNLPYYYEVMVLATTPGFDPLLGEFDVSQSLGDSGTGSILVAVDRDTSPGTAWFAVTGEGDDLFTGATHPYGSYLLAVRPSNTFIVPYEEQEEEFADTNNEFADAESFAPGFYIEMDGTLDSETDVDFFELTGLFEGTDLDPSYYEVTVESWVPESGSLSGDPLLGEFDVSGNLVASATGTILIEVDRHTEPGEAWFAVTGTGDVDFDGTIAHAHGSYTLSIRPIVDDNDTPGTAQEIWSPNPQITSELASGSDQDFYLVHGLEPGKLYQVTADRDILPYDTGTLAPLPVTAAMSLVAEADGSGNMLFSVSGAGGVYTVSVEQIADRGSTLGPPVYYEQEAPGTDSNNTYNKRDVLTPGYLRLEGSLDSPTDVDFFEIPDIYPGTIDAPQEWVVEVIDSPGWGPLLGEFYFGIPIELASGEISLFVWGSGDTGSAYFAISGPPDIDFDGQPDHQYGDYVLEIRPATMPQDFTEIEVGVSGLNDSGASADHFWSPNPKIAGELLPGAGDVDFFLVHGLTPEGIYEVKVGDYLILPYNPENPAAEEVLGVAPAGTMYLRANEDGEILVAVLGGEGTYNLEVTPITAIPEAEAFTEELFYDINDTYALRNVMPPATHRFEIHGAIGGPDGQFDPTDYYEVRLPNFPDSLYPDGGWVEITVTPTSGNVKPWIFVYHDDGLGNPVPSDLYGYKTTEVKVEIDADTDELVVRFEIWPESGTGDYTVEVAWLIDALTVEDGFQELTDSYIRTARFNGSSWQSTGDITPPAGVDYVLPDVVSAPGVLPIVTYTSLELDNAGFPITEMRRWRLDLGSGSWGLANTYESVDVGLRSYFNGEYGQAGDGASVTGTYSDFVASYFNPRIMYGARQLDFEFTWWRNMCGYGNPYEYWVIDPEKGSAYLYDFYRGSGQQAGPTTWGDYHTPLPYTSITNPALIGWEAEGHVAGTSYIHVMRYGAGGWEQLNSQDVLGQTLDSAADEGLNAMVDGLAWGPGFISSVGILGAQPVVAWNHIEKNLIQVRGFSPESSLPDLEITETSGSLNDDMVNFGTVETGTTLIEQITLKNEGMADLVIDDIFVVGSDAFTVRNELGVEILPWDSVTIEPGGGETIYVHFDADAPGVAYARLYVSSNDPLAAPLFNNWSVVTLVGSVYSGADIQVTEEAGIPSDYVVPFGLAAVGEANTRTVTIENTGTEVLNVTLELRGGAHGFTLSGDSVLAIQPGESEDVEIVFEGTADNADGAMGYLIIRHDDYGDESGPDAIADRQPYLVTLVGNDPHLVDWTVVGVGSLPTVADDTVAYSTAVSGIDLYDISDGGLPENVVPSGAGRARSDGDFTVYALGGTVYLYDRTTGATVDLTSGLGLSGAQNPNIEGNRVVLSAMGPSSRDIYLIDLNVDEHGSVDVDDPVYNDDDTVEDYITPLIQDIDPFNPDVDDHPDVTGDWVVWRRGNAEGDYVVFGKDVVTGQVRQLSGDEIDGPLMPRTSGEHTVWVEHADGGNRIVLFDRAGSGSTQILLWQQAAMSDEAAIDGDLVVWADNRTGNYDLYGYFFDSAWDTGQPVDLRDRQFRMTFNPATDETAPDVSGNWLAWEEGVAGSQLSTITYARLAAAPNMEMPVGDVAFGDVTVDVDGTYIATEALSLWNQGTGLMVIYDAVADVTSGSAEVEVAFPDGILLHQGAGPMDVELALRATDDDPAAITGTLAIYLDDPGTPQPFDEVYNYAFTANPVEPELVIYDETEITVITDLDLGQVEIGSDGQGEFYIYNEDSVNQTPLVISSIVASDPNVTIVLDMTPGFSTGEFNEAGHYVLAYDQKAHYQVIWTPTTPGDLAGTTITIESNDVEDPPHALNLTGTAIIAPDFSLWNEAGTSEIDSLDFGAILKGDTAYLSFRVRNDSLTDVTLEWTIDDAAYTLIAPTGTTLDLAQGASAVFTVAFAPDDARTFPATLSITSTNIYATVTHDLALEGEGLIEPDVALFVGGDELETGDLLQAVATDVGDSWTTSLTIRNDGEEELVIDNWQISPALGTPLGVFVIDDIADHAGPDGKVHLGYQESMQVTLTFTPPTEGNWPDLTGLGTFEASLEIYSNDPDEPTFSLSLTGDGHAPVISVTPASLAFGNVEFGETASQTLNITNLGLGALVLEDWWPKGQAQDGFTVTQQSATSLLVTFSPSDVGEHSTTISLFSNDPATPEVTVQVTGFGVAGEIALEGDDISGEGIINFGNVSINTTVTTTVTIRNTGEGTLALGSWVSSDPSVTLVPTKPGVTSLAPEETTSFDVIFSPTSPTPYNVTITINSDDPDTPVTYVHVVAEGVSGRIDVTENSGSLLNDDRLEFGNVSVVDGEVTQTFTIHNVGQDDLTIDDIEIDYVGTSQDLGVYSLSFPGSVTLSPGGSLDVEVTFDPNQAGDLDAVLNVLSDDPDTPSYAIELIGQGIEPDIIVLESSGQYDNDDVVGFEQVKVGVTESLVITIENGGEDTLILDHWTTTHSAFALVPTSPTVSSLAPGATVQLTVQYTPATEGQHSGKIRIYSNDPDEATYEVQVTGTAVGPAIRVTEQSGTSNDGLLEFGDVYIGQTAVIAVTVHNDGDAPLVLSGYESNNELVAVQPDTAITIQPGQSETVNVTFTPAWELDEAGVVTLLNDDPTNPRYEMQVTGRGVPEPAPSDFNGDGQTDMADYERLRAAFGLKTGEPGFDPALDLAGPDGVINFADLAVFADYYGRSTRAPAKLAGAAAGPAPSASAGASAKAITPGSGTSSGNATKSAGSSKSIQAADEGDSGADPMVRENLAAAFDMGALPDEAPGAGDQGLTESADVGETAAAEAESQPADAAASQAMSVGVAPTQITTGMSSASFTFVLGAETSEVKPIGIDDLGELDPLVASYAAALLPG